VLYNIQRIRIARLQLETEMTDASLRSLRAQMKPHFLSNILNSMQYFILSEKPEESGNFVQGFSRMVRHILDASDKNYILLSVEINQLRDYLHFECRRADRPVQMDVLFQYDGDFSNTLIPTMLLQPLIENALMHGIFPLQNREGKITIRIGKAESGRFRNIPNEGLRISDAGRLLVQVCDNGQGREASAVLKPHRPSPSYGMRAIRERLEWMQRKYGIYAEMIIKDRYDAEGKSIGTCITLNLPLLERMEKRAFHPGRSGRPPAWRG
jgi:LytS/YehU family sensor histidine kinase